MEIRALATSYIEISQFDEGLGRNKAISNLKASLQDKLDKLSPSERDSYRQISDLDPILDSNNARIARTFISSNLISSVMDEQDLSFILNPSDRETLKGYLEVLNKKVPNKAEQKLKHEADVRAARDGILLLVDRIPDSDL